MDQTAGFAISTGRGRKVRDGGREKRNRKVGKGGKKRGGEMWDKKENGTEMESRN